MERAARLPSSVEAIVEAVRNFLDSAQRPVLVEPGEQPLALTPEHYRLEVHQGRLLLEAWDRQRILVRQLVAVRQSRPDRLELIVERFGRRRGEVLLYDAESAGPAQARRSRRLVWRELFRRLLRRQFPGWRIEELSASAELEHSLSAAFPRALLRRGATGVAAIAAPPDTRGAGALTYGLIWLDYLRSRQGWSAIEGLALFVPEADATPTCLRLRHLDPRLGRFSVFVLNPEGLEHPIDPLDYGNLDTHLEPCTRPPAVMHPLVERLRCRTGVETVPCSDGSLSFRVRGLEFARAAGESLWAGLAKRRPVEAGEWDAVGQLVAELDRFRSPDAADRTHPLYARQPEAWLESQVRRSLATIDPCLEPEPIYGQVPALAGLERRIIDLLAVDQTGRLAVIELKADADPHLPLQALDYWMRVRWHLEREEFRRLGYFPGRRLSGETPRLLLVAPALEFHPTTEILLRALSPEVPVERIGLAEHWRSELRVVFRVSGAARPGLAPG